MNYLKNNPMSDLIPADIDPRVEFGISRFQIPTDALVEQTLIWLVSVKRRPKMNRALESMGLSFDPNSSDVTSSSIGVLFEKGLRALGMYREDGYFILCDAVRSVLRPKSLSDSFP